MKFLNHLLRAIRQAITSYRYDFLSDTEAGWTDEDAKRTLQFFASVTGTRLKIRLTNYVMRVAVMATKSGDYEHQCGIARGVEMAVQAIEQHFAIPPRSEETPEEKQQEEPIPHSSAAADLALN